MNGGGPACTRALPSWVAPLSLRRVRATAGAVATRANAGRGASGMVGSRSISKGSVGIALTSRVSDSERVARRVRAEPRWRARCGRGERLPREPTNHRDNEGSARRDGADRALRALRGCAPARSARPRRRARNLASGSRRRLRVSRAWRRQWSTSLCRATPMSHATVSFGTASCSTACTAARNVSAVRSSATVSEPVRARRYPNTWGSARSYMASSTNPWSAASGLLTPSTLARLLIVRRGRAPTGDLRESRRTMAASGPAPGLRFGSDRREALR